MRSFIICGAESSGNKLLAHLLIDCGLQGSYGYDQPTDFNIDFSVPWVVINHWSNLRGWVYAFQKNGHEVTLLIPVREMRACTRSMVNHKHKPTIEAAAKSILQTVGLNVMFALTYDIDCELIPYSSLNEEMIKHFLERHGLKRLKHTVDIDNQNHKWYR